ncbi:MAG: STAS domain-containing protein [Nitrincola lacisaponensis]|uniref:Anti-sigma F factor antagonist (SpoIIAA-2) n=2 Tax=Nitrincola lacisaponensis TaxID=267850 RepID=A0A063Y2W5_9GAMM|nr:Anti-sigma F factor antagonist (spoIIAA-2) [Nitrincola lacisaponensis]
MKEASMTIKLPERFDFSYHKDFYNHTADILAKSSLKEVQMDFSQVEYLDSSALGMLVMLQKKCAEVNKRVVVINVSGVAAEILQIANMDKLVDIR